MAESNDPSVSSSSSSSTPPSVSGAPLVASSVVGIPSSPWEHQTQATLDDLRGGMNGINETLTLLAQVVNQLNQRLPPTPAVVKTEPPTPFNRGATYQSDVGVNRDLTPHPVVARVMAGYVPPHGDPGSASSGPGRPPFVGSSSHAPPADRHGLTPLSKPPPKVEEEIESDDDDEKARRERLPLPTKYKGNVATDSLALRSFIQAVERYFTFKQWNMNSRSTLDFAVTLLEGAASQWFETAKKDPALRSWNTLKIAMKNRFEPDDVEERETFALLRLEFRGDVQSFNHAFDARQQLANENIRDNDAVLIFLYRNAMELSQAPNTAWLCTMLKNAIRSEKLVTLSDVKNAALRLEATLRQGRGRGAATATVSSSSFRGASSSSSVPYRAAAGAGASRFQRSGTPVRNPQFNTPVRVNNMHGADNADADYGAGVADGGVQLANMDALFENGNGVDQDDGPSLEPAFHEDESSSSSSAAAAGGAGGVGDDQHAVLLHAMRAQQKFGGRFNLTPEDLLRCRQNGLCFKCKRPGHMSSACPSSADSNTKQPGK